jgi:hypothetical protein
MRNVALVWNANSEEIARYEADGFGRRIMGLHASTQEVVVVADLGRHAREFANVVESYLLQHDHQRILHPCG